MEDEEAHRWLSRSLWRQRALLTLRQPLTAKQMAARLEQDRDECSALLAELKCRGLVRCLNPEARRSRVYWLTHQGVRCQRRLSESQGLPWVAPVLPAIDWALFGWICFSHRSAIVRALSTPMQPSELKKRARMQDPELRMSANNVRDAMRLLLAKGLVVAVRVRGKKHLRYELSETGRKLRELILNANY